MGLNVFGDGPAVQAFEEDANDGPRWKARDFVGKTHVISVHGPKQVTGPYGESTVIVADVVVLDESGPQEFPAAWLSSAAMVDQMRGRAGATNLVAVVDTYQNKKGQTGYKFSAPDPKGLAAAEAFLAAAG